MLYEHRDSVRGPCHSDKTEIPSSNSVLRYEKFDGTDVSDYSKQYNMPLGEMFKGNNGRLDR